MVICGYREKIIMWFDLFRRSRDLFGDFIAVIICAIIITIIFFALGIHGSIWIPVAIVWAIILIDLALIVYLEIKS